MRVLTSPPTPVILESPELEYLPAGWAQAALELRVWRTTVSNVTLVWAVVSVNRVLRLRRVIRARALDSETSAYRNVIDTTEVQMPTATYDMLVADLAGISFPAFAPRRMGCDGETRGIERNGFTTNTTLGWWEGAPIGWEALEAWHAETENILEELLPPVPDHFNIGYRARRATRRLGRTGDGRE